MDNGVKYTGWLTDDNIQFILRHKDFWGDNWKNIKLNKDLNIVLGSNILLRTNTSATYLAYQYSKIPAENRNETQKNVLKNFRENWEKEIKGIKNTIFPITLGGHPGNHWGVLVIERNYGEEGDMSWIDYKFYWVDSIGGYENEIKPLVDYLTTEGNGEYIEPLKPPSRQKDGYNCGVFTCFYIREMVEDDVVDELVNIITNTQLKDFRDKWSAEIGEGKWCKTGGATEEDFGGWDWPSLGIYGEEQISEWFYGTDKPIGEKGLFFEHVLDLILTGFKPKEGKFANWAYQEFKKKKATEIGVEITDKLLDDITPHVFAQSLREGSESLSKWREKYQEYLKPKKEETPEEKLISHILPILDGWKEKAEDSEKEDVSYVIRKLSDNQGTKREQYQSVLVLLEDYPYFKNATLDGYLEQWEKLLPPKPEEEKEKPDEEDNKSEKSDEDDEEIIPDWLFPEKPTKTPKPTETTKPPKPRKTPKPPKEKPHECRICKKNTFYSRAEFIRAHGTPSKGEPSVWVYKSIIICKKPIIIQNIWVCKLCKQEYHINTCKYYSPPPIKIPPPEIFDWENYWKWWFGVFTLDWDSKRFFG
ncbi:MAG: hypothetical protein I3273_03995 [Candidatus Moeniiplasma glomeromycotorum]|nr:hypothetical protein [Candidatus Moeniiplasma glomeromycotorum]